jgi:cation diffusion facilitator CzcD-associated flavoprotein CzcO
MLQMEGDSLQYMQSEIQDPKLQTQLIPNFTIGCKRLLISDDYYPAIAADNVKLVPAGLKQVGGA